MFRLYLSLVPIFILENLGSTFIQISVSDGDGNPTTGLTEDEFLLTETRILNGQIVGQTQLNIVVFQEGNPSFYTIIAVDPQAQQAGGGAAFSGTHILSVTVTQPPFKVVGPGDAKRVNPGQGFAVTQYSVA
jgi:hypothetical protein